MNPLPSFKDIISTPKPLEIKISPTGDKIAYILETPNWQENHYETTCYVYFVASKQSYQLTNFNSECSNLRWFSNDSLALLLKNFSDGKGKKEIFLYKHLIGDGLQITKSEYDILSFECYADGFVFVTNDPTDLRSTMQDDFGEVVHTEEEHSRNALFYCNVQVVKEYLAKRRNSITYKKNKTSKIELPVLPLSNLFSSRFTIEKIFVSDSSHMLFLTGRINDDLIHLLETKNFIIEGDLAKSLEQFISTQENIDHSKPFNSSKKETQLSLSHVTLQELSLPVGSHIVEINKNGKEILIDYHKDGENLFYTQKNIWKLSLQDLSLDNEQDIKSHLINLTESIDQEISKAIWINNLVYFFYYDHCGGSIASFNFDNNKATMLKFDNGIEFVDFDVSKTNLALIGSSVQGQLNIFFLHQESDSWTTTQITNISTIDTTLLGNTEQISWKSRDGTVIEGILRKPTNFDPTRKYPLVLIVHGGPSWISRLLPLEFSDMTHYPTVHFINNDILVLKPNYRGSIGRGAEFLKLNKDNLGVGDLWDIESGVEYLINQGFVDKERVGCMGWSQGGYISAFATVNSSIFKAISVGAGISDWYTYYISTDIRQFTRHYLSGNPFENRDTYLKTSPMTNITQAKTPTLIQHGMADQRVPYSNATELFRVLKDLGVHVELFSYPNMPHGIHKPKENRAIVTQNFAWFSHFLLGRDLNFFKSE